MPRASPDWYIDQRCWRQLVRKMPVPCVDTIVYRGEMFLLGWRTISPYRNVWALIGGRMRHGESFADTSIRNCKQSGLSVQKPKYVGIFPMKFPRGRHDLTICMTAKYVGGKPKPTQELSKYTSITKNGIRGVDPVGENYLKMLGTWRASATLV